MAIEINGKLSQILPLQTGTGKNGEWKKQEFILETDDQFPKQVCMNMWGDKIDELKNLSIGQTIKASVNIESREFNGRWYTDVKVWKLESAGSGAPSNNAAPITNDPEFINNLVTENEGDDLPF
jgi:hypothetical protein